tara:strand:+ start:94 stop:822 length:729 start_codon:yes stop_codon:yes gene_type:complete
MKKKIIENLKTLLIALIIAIIIRSFFFQPFYIPSSSMEPTLLVGDRIFVSKYSYGYSKHSFPFSPPIINNRMLSTKAKYGDLVVFKTPEDNRTDFIKRLVGLPGDKIQIKNGELFINEKKIPRENLTGLNEIMCGGTKTEVVSFNETLPNGVQYKVVYNKIGSMKNSDIYKVPEKHYFFLGDNRDCSRDSRFLSSVGYVHENNLVGKARVIFFSNNTHKGSILKFWNWYETLRLNRFFKKLK